MDEPHILLEGMGDRPRHIAMVTMAIERLRDEMDELAKRFDPRWERLDGSPDYRCWLDRREDISELESKLEQLKLDEEMASGAEAR